MKAIALIPGTTQVALTEVDEPQLVNPDDIKIRMRQVGICGTDREQVEGGRSDAPPGKDRLIIGHEMFGQVVEVGPEVTVARVGDFGVFSVRRGCGECLACLNFRSDLCYTGKYTERGIKAADGFQSEFVVDKDDYFIPVPEAIRSIGVLAEPMSVAQKAIDEAVRIQTSRLQGIIPGNNWLDGKRALVAGIGAIGLMAAFVLRLRGAEVIGMDVVEEESLRPSLLKKIGGTYVNGKNTAATDLDQVCGEVDIIVEATGIASLQIELIDALAMNGIYVATGIPGGSRPATVKLDDLMKQMVLKNQVMFGSVNASMENFRTGVADLQLSTVRWPGVIEQVITTRTDYQDFDAALHHHSPNDIKVVIEWDRS